MKTGSQRWRDVSLGDICEFKYGKSLPEDQRQGDTYEVFGSNGMVGIHNKSITDGETIVIGRKGSFGEVHFSQRSCWPIDTTYYVDNTSTKEDLRWLMYRPASIGLTRINRSKIIPGLNREDAYRLRLLLPPIEEQRRIVKVLDQAEGLRAKRSNALAQLDTLIQSIFLDLFAKDDSAKWPLVNVADVASSADGSIRTGPFGSQLLHSEFVDQGIAVLGIDNAVHNEFRWGIPRFITERKYQELKRYTVHPEDVLITIMGTCGRCAIVPGDVPLAINTKHLCCITLDQQKCLPVFLHAYFLRHPTARRYLDQTAKGAIMAGLNMAIIKDLPIRLPPLQLQRRFARLSKGLRDLRSTKDRSLGELEELFVSIQHGAFAGEI